MGFSEWWSFNALMIDTEHDAPAVYEFGNRARQVVYRGSSPEVRTRLRWHLWRPEPYIEHTRYYRVAYCDDYDEAERLRRKVIPFHRKLRTSKTIMDASTTGGQQIRTAMATWRQGAKVDTTLLGKLKQRPRRPPAPPPARHYYIERHKRDNGEYVIHRAGCKDLPEGASDRHWLGYYTTGYDALAEARVRGFTTTNGCWYCTREILT